MAPILIMKLLQTIYLTFLFHNSFGSLTTRFPALDKRDRTRDSIASCVSTIAQKFFPRGEIITVTSPTINDSSYKNSIVQNNLISRMSKQSNWLFLTREAKAKKSNIVFTKKSHNYVIVLRQDENLRTMLGFLKGGTAWNPKAKFVVVTNDVLDPENVTIISKILWSEKVLNFITLSPIVPESDYINVQTWFPYDNFNCGHKFNNTVIINHCFNGTFDDLSKVFIDKVPYDLNGCPVRVRTVIWPPYVIKPKNFNRTTSRLNNINFTRGLEVKLMNTIAQTCNFYVNYSVSEKIQDWGLVANNGNATGLFQDLLEEKADIGISSIAATLNRYIFLEPSLPYTTESITWCVPTAQLKPKWLSLFNILSLETWLDTIVTYIIVAFFVWVLSYKHRKESRLYYSISACYVYIFSLITANSIKIKPRSDPVRIVFFFWVIFCLHLTAVYQTVLIDNLVTPLYEKQIHTFDEIVDSGLNFSYLMYSKQYFSLITLGDRQQQKVAKEGAICLDADVCLKNIALNRNESFAVPRLYLQYMANIFKNSEGKPLLYWFKDDFVSFPVHMYSYRGFPIMDRINEQIARITQTGIMSKWIREVENTFNVKKALTTQTQEDDPTNLTLSELQGAFIIYAIGSSIAAIIFVSEIVVTLINEYIKRKNDTNIFIH